MTTLAFGLASQAQTKNNILGGGLVIVKVSRIAVKVNGPATSNNIRVHVLFCFHSTALPVN